MRRINLCLLIGFLSFTTLFAKGGDTTFVSTFGFDIGRSDKKIGTFKFPDGSKSYSKVLMYYTIKCDPTGDYVRETPQDFPCGEWDFDVFTDIVAKNGVDAQNNPIYKVKYRIWTYITPYGINLDKDYDILNKEGWTYVYDVTDFLPVLKDSVTLRDNNKQELVDIKFAFIEGTPAREVKSIKPVWSSIGYGEQNYWEGFPLKNFNNLVKDTTFTFDAQDKYVSLKTTVTGHMMDGNNAAAEFSKNTHRIVANGKEIRQWQILIPCATNPMYPQGGTWVYARAGWCPGIGAITQNTDLTPHINNNKVSIDYAVDPDPNGVYRIYSYLVSYGDIQQQDDVEAVDIIAPTNNPNHGRINPTTLQPIVVIKNIGKNNLSSLNISYGLNDNINYYAWSGDLKFNELDTIMLPTIAEWNKIEGNSATFFFELHNPNGAADPTSYNNSLKANCKKPAIVPSSSVVFNIKTNSAALESSWFVTNIFGDTVAGSKMFEERTGAKLKNNTSYKDTMILEDGNYKFVLLDKDNDGLSFFANRDGAGSASLTYIDESLSPSKEVVVHKFNPNFGSYAQINFAVNRFYNTESTSVVSTKKIISSFPNPAKNYFVLNLQNVEAKQPTMDLVDVSGKMVISSPLKKYSLNRIDTHSLNNGIYMAIIKDGGRKIATAKISIIK